MAIRTAIRDSVATLFRNLPRFRGKSTIGLALQKSLTNYASSLESIVTFRMRDGSWMRVDLRSATEQRSYWTGDYDPEAMSALSRCLPAGAIALDVGANVGFYTVALGRRLNELGGKLYSFEPVQTNFDRVIALIELNGLERVVTPIQLALGDEEGVIHIHMDDRDHATTGNAFIVLEKDKAAKPNFSARITRLDQAVGELGIAECHLVKIDIEGAELSFLKGGQQFLSRCRPIIHMEFNYYWMEHFGYGPDDLIGLVKSWGYTFHVEGHDGYRPYTGERSPLGLENLLMIPMGTPLGDRARKTLQLA